MAAATVGDRMRNFKASSVAPQVAGVVSEIRFQSGDDVEAGAPLVDLDTSVEEADLADGRAQLKNANVTLERARALIANGNTPQSTVERRWRRAIRRPPRSTAATGDRREDDRAPFDGRLGLRNVDLGQYVAPAPV